jgi:hypothetical protein
MRKFVCVLVVSAVAAAASSLAGNSDASPASTVSGTRSCGAGYVHANLTWGEKCLRAGQFCKVGNNEYRAYGYTCPSTGHLTYSTRRSNPAPVANHPPGATAKCNDGSYSYSAHHSGTCSYHGGVATFYT